MTFDDQKRLQAREALAAGTLPPPRDGDRICENCQPPVRLVNDMTRLGYEYHCPKCGRYEEWFGTRFSVETNATSTTSPQPSPTKAEREKNL